MQVLFELGIRIKRCDVAFSDMRFRLRLCHFIFFNACIVLERLSIGKKVIHSLICRGCAIWKDAAVEWLLQNATDY